MIRIHKVDFDTEATYAEMITFKDSRLQDLLKHLDIDNNKPKMICSGFEVFCYRPKRNKPYHPYIYPTYIRAREQTSRVLDAIYLVITNPERKACISFAQIRENISDIFFKNLSKKNKKEVGEQEIIDFATSVDNWIGEFYTNQLWSKQYRTKNRYPIAPKPLEGTALYVITSDEDGNLISYQTEV
ncbi:MAG: hypothetical protein ACRAVC_17845, partial [Trichormus sp.]